ncbi:MAG: LytTR family transcriptional regulator DNA-binding domain-containing protein [Crocinitomicaceae bacterium]|nr:LytTR family transcriptional regulator DNA-binding domain-containing protein [Crocinitomicaceae bacterium]
MKEFDFEITDVVDSYEKALLSLRKNLPDLVILDIRLNGPGTGIDVAREIYDRWKIPFLFISSNIDPKTMSEVLDEVPHSILNKPCKPDDLIVSVKLALSKEAPQVTENEDTLGEDSFFMKSEHAYQKIVMDDLLYVKGEGSYTKVQLKKERIVLRATLKDFDFLENRKEMLRVHRSYYVNLKYIDSIHSKYLTIQEYEIPLSKETKELLLNRIQKVR